MTAVVLWIVQPADGVDLFDVSIEEAAPAGQEAVKHVEQNVRGEDVEEVAAELVSTHAHLWRR